MKYWKFSWDFVLHGISWQNLSMLLATIPKYSSEAEKKKAEKAKEVEGIDDLAGLLGL